MPREKTWKMRETGTHVYFWSGPLSQWHPSEFATFLPSGRWLQFGCAEQYMMAAKAELFDDLATLAQIMATQDPSRQKELARAIRGFQKDAWEAEADTIVVNGNLAKFAQNASLRETLLETADKVLVEGSPYDLIWGVGLDWNDPRIENDANWVGANRLGKALEIVRERIRKH